MRASEVRARDPATDRATGRAERSPIRVVDIAGAVGLTVFCVLVGRRQSLTSPDARPADVLQAVAISVACLALVVRRPLPVVAALVSSAGCAFYLARGYTGGPVLLVPLIALYYAGYHLDRREIWRLLAAYSAVMTLGTVFSAGLVVVDWLWLLAWVPLAVFVTFAGFGRRRSDLETALKLAEEDRRQHAEARRQLAEERLQMARELHDVLGHSLASITILAGAGSRRVADDPAAAKEVLDEIRSVSATALADVRRALESLNDPAHGVLGDPSGDLAELIERLRRVGLNVDDRLEVDPAELDRSVAIGLYRIAQESLTNVMRHAGSLHASVSVVASGGGVEMTIADWGTTGAGPIVDGLGIAGMRRRAEELGGQLTTSWSDHGGMTVVAWVPVAVAARKVEVS